MVSAQAGDDGAFEQLVRRHQGPVRGLLRRLAHDHAAADDLAQGAFLRAWQKLGEFRGGSFRSWVCTIAYREFLQQQRRAGGRQAPENEIEPVAVASPSGAGMDLDQAIGALSQSQRHAVLLSLVVELSHAEIVDLTGWPLGTVKSHVARGKARLRTLLEGYADDATD